MNRRNRQDGDSGGGVGRLFLWTAILGIVFGAGLITGQRLLVDESHAPVVSVGQTPSTFAATEPVDGSTGEESEEPALSIFSFYDALTSSEPQDVAPRPAPVVDAAPAPSAPAPVEAAPVEVAPAEPEPVAVEPVEAASLDEESPEALEAEVAQAPAPAEESPELEEPQPAEVEAVAEESVAEVDAPARYTLQVASHPTIERARAEMDRLRGLGLDPQIVAAEVPGQGQFYRVRVGSFHTMDQARAFQTDVQTTQEIQTFVTPL